MAWRQRDGRSIARQACIGLVEFEWAEAHAHRIQGSRITLAAFIPNLTDELYCNQRRRILDPTPLHNRKSWADPTML